jgi:hypothetical protein
MQLPGCFAVSTHHKSATAAGRSKALTGHVCEHVVGDDVEHSAVGLGAGQLDVVLRLVLGAKACSDSRNSVIVGAFRSFKSQPAMQSSNS